MKNSKLLGYCLPILFLFSCNTSQKTVVLPVEELEMRDLDTMVITATREVEATESIDVLPPYQRSYTRANDLLHTKLELEFSWEKEQVLGKATIKLKPLFYPTNELELDAKGFDIHQIKLDGPKGKNLKYDYDGQVLVIQLDKEYTRKEEYSIYIDYTASPSASGGSAAITSDKGLFFINSTGEEDKPQQIWTQGETEHNSRWFPTIDKPNERCTQEMMVTVQDRFTTLSNGLLMSSNKNEDGTRTDYWKLDQPHAPYLFMLAIGELAVIEEEWEGRPVTYYVEPEYEEDATSIFAHTKEMLSFFSDILGVKYPWPKYAQVVVQDYVSGAMENTTASIFGDFVQKKKRELIDDNNDKIVAHELFHHWFGDLVTCESWANLTMNEGFANYSEYLWLEHKYGADEADYHLLGEWSGYYGSGDIHPLIYFGYEDKEDMFDAHSYNKGGSVLHMLRSYIGDEAFFAGLNKYLTENAYTAVEAHNLRLAFESVTGQDLNWFFNQWYFEQGHPQLEITYSYDETLGQAAIRVQQQQDPQKMPAIFELPVAVDIYPAGSNEATRKEVVLNQRDQTFTFDLDAAPQLITFDAERMLLAQVQDNKTAEQYIYQFYNAPKFYDRYEAVQRLVNEDSEEAKGVYQAALQDPFWVIRGYAITQLQQPLGESTIELLQSMAATDKHSQVRATAFEKLMELEEGIALEAAKTAINNDSAYVVIGLALQYLSQYDKTAALAYAQKLESEDAEDLLLAIGELYAESDDLQKLSFFEENLSKMNGFPAIYFLDAYQALTSKGGMKYIEPASQKLASIAIDMGRSGWQRYGATRALNQLRIGLESSDDAGAAQLAEELLDKLREIKKVESNEQLQSFYEQLLPAIRP
jgi:aminopeptidase N